MLVYSPIITNRLRYITAFAGNQLTGQPFRLTTDQHEFLNETGAKLNYSESRLSTDECWIQPHGLLGRSTIEPVAIQCFDADGIPAFFSTAGDFSFDIFAASFYLLSRYEEYLPHVKDSYGRYAHENALAYKESFLNRPLVNEWMQTLGKVIASRFSISLGYNTAFCFIPTYDIDIAWSFLHKGFWRNFGGLFQSLVKGKFRQLVDRLTVLTGARPDPFDTYGWMNRLHQIYQVKPYYFFLTAAKTGRYDKNISPRQRAMVYLIRDHFLRYPVGIHPSWQSGDDDEILLKEIETLSKITGKQVLSSRQHYIRLSLPETFRKLLKAGIRFDFSMGYGSINGFRASVATPFYWYDLEKEVQTDLLLFPFCFMEANSYYEQKFSAEQALAEMRHYFAVTKAVNGYMIMIWHNHFFGSDPLFAGWKEAYETIVKEISSSIAEAGA